MIFFSFLCNNASYVTFSLNILLPHCLEYLPLSSVCIVVQILQPLTSLVKERPTQSSYGLQVVIEQTCRLARLISSPHEVAHCVLVAEGCPGRCVIIANLAAHLCGYSVYKINPSPISSAAEYNMDSFKSDLVNAYMKAGVKVGA